MIGECYSFLGGGRRVNVEHGSTFYTFLIQPNTNIQWGGGGGRNIASCKQLTDTLSTQTNDLQKKLPAQ